MTQTIFDFYKGRKIFMTGASGLMGKVLIEKMLYSLPDLEKIYILVRPKRGKSPESRVEEMWKLPMFARIREEKPHVMKKVVAIHGDLLYDDLGMDSNQLEEITREVSIVFHFAATLKLEAPLKDGIEFNTCGTRRVIDLAKRVKNLVAFIHLSTAFCYPDYDRLGERVHAPPTSPQDMMRAIEWMTPKQLEILTPSLLQSHPNSYTYSKRLAEALVAESFPQLPAVIVRPSIVTPSFKEPIPGWVDNLNGPIGLMVGAGKGVIRTMHCNGDYHAEVIPVDIAINAIIAIGYKIGKQTQRAKELPVFNLTTGDDRNTTWKEVLDIGKATVRKYPFEGPLWYPDGNIRSNQFIHKLCVFFYHLVPAYLIDFLLLIFGQKRFMVRIQNRISVGLEVLQYFTTREWWFDTDNFKSLTDDLSPDEQKVFPMDLTIIEDASYIECCMVGGKKYCLKEKMENLPRARLHNNILYYVDRFFTVFFYFMIVYWAVCFSEPLRQILSLGGPVVRHIPMIGPKVFSTH